MYKFQLNAFRLEAVYTVYISLYIAGGQEQNSNRLETHLMPICVCVRVCLLLKSAYLHSFRLRSNALRPWGKGQGSGPDSGSRSGKGFRCGFINMQVINRNTMYPRHHCSVLSCPLSSKSGVRLGTSRIHPWHPECGRFRWWNDRLSDPQGPVKLTGELRLHFPAHINWVKIMLHLI